MTKTLLLAVVFALSAQAASFEVASITPCKPGTPEPPGEHMGMVKFISPGGRFRGEATSLKYLIEWSYGILPAQHSAGPAWMGTDRYDVVAKAEGNPTDDQMKLMVQSLLDERFHLRIRRETRTLPAYVLTLGKSAPKLAAPKEDETQSLRVEPKIGPDQKPVSWHVTATRYSIAQLTDTFSRQLGSVIVNRTGLNGEYNFVLDMTPDENTPNPLDPSLILDALKNQLGFTVKTQDTPVDFLIIENAEKVAAGN